MADPWAEFVGGSAPAAKKDEWADFAAPVAAEEKPKKWMGTGTFLPFKRDETGLHWAVPLPAGQGWRFYYTMTKAPDPK